MSQGIGDQLRHDAQNTMLAIDIERATKRNTEVPRIRTKIQFGHNVMLLQVGVKHRVNGGDSGDTSARDTQSIAFRLPADQAAKARSEGCC